MYQFVRYRPGNTAGMFLFTYIALAAKLLANNKHSNMVIVREAALNK